MEIVGPQNKYHITAMGLVHVEEMAALGCSKTEIADYFQVDKSFFSRVMDPEDPAYDAEVHECFLRGDTTFKQRLRRHQLELSENNATMAVHLGKQYLNQKDQVQEHHHVHQVVGTMPDYDKTSDEWKKQFAPTGIVRIADSRVEEAQVIDATAESDEDRD